MLLDLIATAAPTIPDPAPSAPPPMPAPLQPSLVPETEAESGFAVADIFEEDFEAVVPPEAVSKDVRILEKPEEKVSAEPIKKLEIISREKEEPEEVCKAEKKPIAEVRKFERWLGDDAGAPGALERLVAQSLLIMKLIQKTIGVSFVIIANGLDTILGIITGYVGRYYFSSLADISYSTPTASSSPA